MESGEPTEHFPRNILTSYCPTETCFITNAGFQCQILQVWHLLLLIFEFLEVFMSPLKRNKITGNHAVFTIRTVYIRILDNMYIYTCIYIYIYVCFFLAAHIQICFCFQMLILIWEVSLAWCEAFFFVRH